MSTSSPARAARRTGASTACGTQRDLDRGLERVIAAHVRAYRVAAGASVPEAAQRTGICTAVLSTTGSAQTSCGPTALARLAGALPGGDLVAALGESPGRGAPREAGADDEVLGAAHGGDLRVVGDDADVEVSAVSAAGARRTREPHPGAHASVRRAGAG